MIVWITGISGAGKTTIGKELCKQWRRKGNKVVLLDGDELRHLFKQDKNIQDYSIPSRRKSAERTVMLCEWLDSQDIDVICSSIAMFSDLRKENRHRFKNYFEIHLDVTLETVKRRDPKGLYRKYEIGEMRNIVGIDLPFEDEKTQDITIDNNSDTNNITGIAKDLLSLIQENKCRTYEN